MATKRDPPWQAAFLHALALSGNVKVASQNAGIDRTTAYKRQKANDAFAKAWAEAIEEAADGLEQEALRRAVTGWDEPVYGTTYTADGKRQKGVVGVVRKYSDTLLLALLSAHRPEKFGRTRLEHSGPGGGPIPYRGDAEAFVDGELIRLSEKLRTSGGRPPPAASPEAVPATDPVEPGV